MTDPARAINEPLAALLHGTDEAANEAARRTRGMVATDGIKSTWRFLQEIENENLDGKANSAAADPALRPTWCREIDVGE